MKIRSFYSELKPFIIYSTGESADQVPHEKSDQTRSFFLLAKPAPKTIQRTDTSSADQVKVETLRSANNFM